jgi:hypothetical protein
MSLNPKRRPSSDSAAKTNAAIKMIVIIINMYNVGPPYTESTMVAPVIPTKEDISAKTMIGSIASMPYKKYFFMPIRPSVAKTYDESVFGICLFDD